MKRILFLLLLSASLASAQVYPPDSSGSPPYDGGAVTNPILLPDGAAGAPAIAFSGNTDMGGWRITDTFYLQNTQAAASGQSLLNLGTETLFLSSYQNGDASDYSYIGCGDDGADDMRCYVDLSDGTNSSTTYFLNTGTTFTDPILGPNGSASAVTFGISGNPDMGMFTNGSALILQNTQLVADSKSALTLGDQLMDLVAYKTGDTGNYGGMECYLSTDMLCSIWMSDGTNTSQTDFTNTATTFSDPVLIPDGDINNPGLAFANDIDLGVWYVSAGRLKLQSASGTTSRSELSLGAGGNLTLAGFTSEANNKGSIDIADVGDNYITITSTDSNTSDLARIELQSGDTPNWVSTVNDDTNSSTVTFGTTSTTFTDPIYQANGAVGGPSYAFTNFTTTGAYAVAGPSYNIAVGGTQELSIGANQFLIENGGTGSLPAFARISDTNTGFFWPDATGDEFGISVGGYAKWQARHTAKDLTESSATNVVRFTIQNSNGLGATVNWTVIAKDATDQQSRRGSTYIAAVNKSGTITCAASDVGTSAFAESAGASTLTATTSCVTGTNEVFFAINAVSSLTQTSLQARWTAEVDGETSVTHEQ